MPIYEYHCSCCNNFFEALVGLTDISQPCPSCGKTSRKIPSVSSFKIKGLRAANGYGLKFLDSYGKDRNGEEVGYSFHSNKSDTIVDHNMGPKKEKE
jgi:putative FmdB family regulatory protein